mmetsp:Transcript_24809/g.57129  ORF Transcript_24809/g.57129 Transcript_24809/m.57129 type:complete len:237 (-) Transcript_24809:861-1571(-)
MDDKLSSSLTDSASVSSIKIRLISVGILSPNPSVHPVCSSASAASAVSLSLSTRTGSVRPAFCFSVLDTSAGPSPRRVLRSYADLLRIGRSAKTFGVGPYPKAAVRRLSESAPFFVDGRHDDAGGGGAPPKHVVLRKTVAVLHRFLDRFAACVLGFSNSSDKNAAETLTSRRQLRSFVDPSYVPEGLLVDNDEYDGDSRNDKLDPGTVGISTVTSEQDSASLRQYFASEENSRLVR